MERDFVVHEEKIGGVQHDEIEGAYFAIFGVAAKAAFGLAVLVVGVALDVSGFAPNVAQGGATILLVRVLLGLIPCALLIGAVALMFSFRLDEREHAAIRSRLGGRAP